MFAQVTLLLAFIASFTYATDLRGGSTTCVCTTVTCPVPGNNYLTEGKHHLHLTDSQPSFERSSSRKKIFSYIIATHFIDFIAISYTKTAIFSFFVVQVADQLALTTTSVTTASLLSPLLVQPLPRLT